MKNNSLSTFGVISLAILGIFSLVFIGWVYGVFAYGFVIAKIWGWFMVGDPFLLPAITWVQAAALFVVVRFLTSSHTVKVNTSANASKSTSDKVVESLVPLLSPWLTLLFAWAFKVVFM